MKFLHTADWQIGMTRHFLRGEAQARFTAARLDAIRRLGDVAREQECEFIVVCGDVFEANQLSRQTVGRALEALATLPVPVYLLPGNHDPLDPVTIYRSPQFVRDCPDHVHVLDSTDPETVREGVELVPAPWSGKHPDEDLVGAAVSAALAGERGEGSGPLRIVVGHGAVDLLDPDRANAASIAVAPLEEHLAAGRLHYVALGDRHSRTSVGSSGAIWYSGAAEVTDFREELPGDVLVVDLEHGRAPVVTPHHVGRWSYRTVRREVNGADDVADLARDLGAIPDKDRTVVRLALRGALGVGAQASLSDLLEEQAEIFAALFTWDRHTELRVSAADEELADLGLGGFLGAAAQEIQHLAQPAAVDRGESGGDGAADPGVQSREHHQTGFEFAADVQTGVVEAADATEAADADADPLEWEFVDEATPDGQSSADALALLYRFAHRVSEGATR